MEEAVARPFRGPSWRRLPRELFSHTAAAEACAIACPAPFHDRGVKYVVDALVVPDVLEVLPDRIGNRNGAEGGSEVLGELLGITACPRRRAKPRHRDRQDAIAREPRDIEHADCH